MQDLNTVCLLTFSHFSSSSGRSDGEGGIIFDNEEEKEQWQEDQKVGGILHSSVMSFRDTYSVFPCLF